ncbi:MAG: acyl transferase [Chitinophagales bacterium]
MENIVEFKSQIFNTDKHSFANKALALFNYQVEQNPVYRKFLQYLDISPQSVSAIEHIPFLPIEFFRTHKIITGDVNTGNYFESSGTTSELKSLHYISDSSLYIESIVKGFELFHGEIKNYCYLALLPSYLERKHSSLVMMCNELINRSNYKQSGFYLNEYEKLIDIVKRNEAGNIPTILIGVSFALLELAEHFQLPLKNTIIMETGGMKGRRKEITREELHAIIKSAFGINTIHSEYGMTELLSQAYSNKDGLFFSPPWLKVFTRDAEDPFKLLAPGKTGCLNIIDLVNIHSCSFIATRDLGRINADNSFEVIGRLDNSDIRGCNLLI